MDNNSIGINPSKTDFLLLHSPEETHEDTADFPPASWSVRYESLALLQTEVTAQLQRELVLLVKSEEARWMYSKEQ